MTALFEMPSEILSNKEIREITGEAERLDQCKWLTENGWYFIKNRANLPIVGRMYARLKLAGIDPSFITQLKPTSEPSTTWQPPKDFK
jgi:hypothetical protein